MKFLENFDQVFRKIITRDIPNQRFWDFVDRVEWEKYVSISSVRKPKESEDPLTIDSIMKNIAPYHTYEEFVNYERMYNKLEDMVRSKLTPLWLGRDGLVRLNISDNSFEDVISSVIGFGQKFCKSVISDNTYSIVRKMVKDGNYSDNFGYIFSNEYIHTNLVELWNIIYLGNNFDKEREKEILSFVNDKSNDRFWEFVEKVNWYKQENFMIDYGKSYLIENIAPYFSHDEFKQFHKVYKKLEQFLRERLENVKLIAQGDHLWDLRSSIVGSGKDTYIKVIKGDDNNKLVNRIDQYDDYYENFGYIFTNHYIDITNPNEDCKEEWDIVYNKNNK